MYIDGRKHAQIKPKSERQYRLDLPPATTLPTTFALHSLSSNGHLSVPSQIILHGIHKSAAASDAVKIGMELREITLLDYKIIVLNILMNQYCTNVTVYVKL